MLAWDWCDRRPAERGLRGGLAYYDLAGQMVSVMISEADNQVTETLAERRPIHPLRPETSRPVGDAPGKGLFASHLMSAMGR
jgi:hypothetical protein